MKKSCKTTILATAVLLVFLTGSLSAQTWSDEQLEVWQNEQVLWKLWATKNIDSMLMYYHDDYMGWSDDAAVPGDKATVAKWMKYQYKTNSVDIYEITPLAITVIDDVAVVHYVYTIVIVNDEGAKSTYTGKWTDVVKKQDGMWLIIGDHGSSDDDD